ncbi:MAG: hypothetical protein P4L45_05595 [Ignavibacteriaceae bacterium]|nr:hypothetical protein [Ignavibacteriaceae bacterium]
MKKEQYLSNLLYVLIIMACCQIILFQNIIAQNYNKVQNIEYKVGFLGVPDNPVVNWDDANISKMKEIGFNVMQLNIAWGSRPNDEALNLEDIVDVPKQFILPMDKNLSKTLRTGDKIEARSEKLRQRISVCRRNGMRTIFHFGAPFVGFPPQQTEPLPQCIMDSVTINRYIKLIREFGKKFPGVDDLLLYTYDQDAWLCSENGPCPRCHGIPVANRVAAFVNTLAREWKKINPDGKLWWEPWELSAGEVYSAADLLDSTCVGLSIHSNIAEVQIAFPADRWFKNINYLAWKRNIPVIAELWMGCPTEELEPFTHIPAPLLTLQALRAVNSAGALKGIKEYYGNVPDEDDPNLRMTQLFFHNAGISDSSALAELAACYGEAAEGVKEYWKLASEAVAFYPWDVSWHARETGRSDPQHLMTAAILKGASWNTPDWQSSRRTYFMRTDENNEPNFWMREDMQLRFEQTAYLMSKAIKAADSVKEIIPSIYKTEFNESVKELTEFRRRVLSYEYHLHETNLTDNIRSSIKLGLPKKDRLKNISELKEILIKDIENQQSAEPITSALKLLDNDLNRFLKTYFLPSKTTNSKGDWSITSN